MNIFQEISLLKKIQGPLTDLKKEFAMKLSTNVISQIVLTIGQLVNNLSGLIPYKAQALVTGILAGIQLVIGAVAQYSNPDGTPSTTAYVPTKDNKNL